MESPVIAIDKAVAFATVVFGSIGLLSNGIVVYCALRNADLRIKDYIRLIINRALLDSALCCTSVCLQPLGLLGSSSRISWCTAAAFCTLAFGQASIYSELAMGALRYCAIVHKNVHKKFGKPRCVNLICVSLWVIGFVAAFPHLFTGSLGSVPGLICIIKFHDRQSIIWIICWNHIPLIFCLSLVAACNFKALRFIRKHQKQQTTWQMRNKLQNDKEIIVFVTVAALVPFVFDGPSIVVTILFSYNPAIVSEWAMFASISLFVLSPAVNPIVSVLMIKPLKKEFLSFYRNQLFCMRIIFNRKQTTTTTTMVASIDQVRNNQ